MTKSRNLRCRTARKEARDLDLGYVDQPETRARGDALIAAGISRKRFSIEGHNRLLVELPPKKIAGLLAAFPIVEGSTYWQATHHWRGLAPGEETVSAA